MSFTNQRARSLPSNSAIGKHLRVKLSSGYLALAGITDQDIGVTPYTILSGDARGTFEVNNMGTQKVVAATAVTAGAKVYTAASGKVSATAASTSFLRGIALEAATADGDIIEIVPLIGDTAN